MIDFSIFKKNLSSLAEEVKKGRSEIEKLRQQRDVLLSAPPTKEEMIGILHARIDAMGSGYPANLQAQIQYYMGHNAHDLANGRMGLLLTSSSPENFNYSGQIGNTTALLDVLVYLLQDQFKEGITRAVMAMQWPAGVVPLKGRADALKALDEKIDKLEKADKKLLESAAEAGITLNF